MAGCSGGTGTTKGAGTCQTGLLRNARCRPIGPERLSRNLLARRAHRPWSRLFSETIRVEPAGHETADVMHGKGLEAASERPQQEAPVAQWMATPRAETAQKTGDLVSGSRSGVTEQSREIVTPEPWQAPAPFGQDRPGFVASAEESAAMYMRDTSAGIVGPGCCRPFSSGDANDEDRVPEYSAAPSAAAMLDEDQPAMIPLAEREQQLARLAYVCQWLRDARQPLCPLNGALTLLPLSTIEAGPREVVELQKAVKADLASIQNELQLRFPVTALAIGLEEDRGFEELIRRVGRERAKSQRFGHRFDVRAEATPTQLTALCTRISGVFEDWVYAIFRERGAVSRAGNSHLFGLLCKVRTQLQDRLVRILCGGFGHDPEKASRGEPVAFSGCYFAATGRTDDSRAFVEGVFDKLNEEQDNVEWTKEALREDRHFRRIGWVGLLVIAACGAALLAGHFLRQM